MYNLYKEKGYIKTFDWRLYDGENPVFETEAVSKELLRTFLEKAHRAFYFRPSYIWKRLRGIRSYSEFRFYASVALKMFFDVVSYKR